MLPARTTRKAAPAANGGIASALRPALKLGALAGVLAFAALSLMAPRYTAETRLILQPQGAAAGKKVAPEILQKQARIVAAPELAASVATELKLAEKVEFNRARGFPDMWSRLLALAGFGGPAPTGSEEDDVRTAVQRHIDAAPLTDAGQLAIRFRASDPALAAAAANAVAAAYIRSLKPDAGAETAAPQSPPASPAAPVAKPETDANSAPDANAAARVKELSDRVTAQSAEIAAYETERNRLAVEQAQRPKPQAAADPRIADFTAELTRARAVRAEADATLKATREAVKTNNFDGIADLQRSPNVQMLLQERARLEHQINELSATLLPEHPRMQQLNSKLAGFKREIAVAVGKSVEKLERDAKLAAAREEALKKSIDEMSAPPAATTAAAVTETKIRMLDTTLKDRRAALERAKAELAEAERARAAAADAAPKAAADTQANTAPAAAPAGPVASGTTQPAIEALVAKPAEADGLEPAPNKLKLSLMAAGLAAALGLLLGLFKSAIGGARAKPATAPEVATAAVDEVEDEMVPALAKSAKPAAPVSKSATAGLAAALAAKLSRNRAEPPIVPAEPRAAAGSSDAHVLEGEALGSAGELDGIAAAILSRPAQDIGIRTLVTGETDDLQPGGEALAIARRLVANGKSVVLVDWSTEGRGFAHDLGITAEPGVNELLIGRASFEDIVQCLAEINGSELHVIAAGGDLSDRTDALDPDVVNLVLDALDEVYDHIVIVGRHGEARELFEAILGRFDVGVVIHQAGTTDLPRPGTFLGFEVTDIETLSCTRHEPVESTPAPVTPEPEPATAAVVAPVAPEVSELPPADEPVAPVAPAAARAAGMVASAVKSMAKVKKAPAEQKPAATVSQAAIARALRTTRGPAPAEV